MNTKKSKIVLFIVLIIFLIQIIIGILTLVFSEANLEQESLISWMSIVSGLLGSAFVIFALSSQKISK